MTEDAVKDEKGTEKTPEEEKTPDENGAENGEEAASEDSGSESEASGGGIEVEGKFGYVAEVYAYESINRLGAVVANRVNRALKDGDKKPPVVLIVNDMEYAPGETARLEIERDIEEFSDLFDELESVELPELPPVIPAPVPESEGSGGEARHLFGGAVLASTVWKAVPDAVETINSVLDVIERLRPSYKIYERDFDISDVALRTATAGSLARADSRCRTYLSGFHLVSGSGMLTKIADLRKRLIGLLAKAQARATLLDLCRENGGFDLSDTDNIEKLSENLTFVAKIEGAGKQFQSACESWTLVKDEQKMSRLEDALTSERMNELDITHVLWIGILSAGGEAMTKERRIFPSGGGFLGGAVVSYVLSSKDGEVLRSDLLPQVGAASGRLGTFFGGGVKPEMAFRHGRED